MQLLLPRTDLRRLLFFSRPFLRCLSRHHLIRLPDQLPQLIPPHRIEPVQHHPLVAPDIGSRMNVLALDQLRKSLRRALETKPRIVQANNRKDLSSDLEEEIVAPLQILSSLRESQAKFANRVCIHAVSILNRIDPAVNQTL